MGVVLALAGFWVRLAFEKDAQGKLVLSHRLLSHCRLQ